MSNPFIGVLLHWLGGLAAGSFYVAYKGVKRWSWETYWLVGGVFSWIVCPGLFALILTKDLAHVLHTQQGSTLWWTYFFGVLWGFGGLTFGLAVRYLGLSLGVGVALGFCAALGTLLPALLKSLVPSIPVAEALRDIAATVPGQITLGGIGVCLVGIAIAALAGWVRERETRRAAAPDTAVELSFRKGLLVAVFSGVMSACFAFGLAAGNPIAEASRAAGTDPIWTGLPKLVIVLVGGFTTNFVWCIVLHVRRRSGREYLARETRPAPAPTPSSVRVPLLANYFWSALAGVTWYLQFFFYTMGETQMGRFGFASWTLHMASIIIFSTMWGWILHEWRGSSRRAHTLIAVGVVTLVLSTIIVGYGTYLKART